MKSLKLIERRKPSNRSTRKRPCMAHVCCWLKIPTSITSRELADFQVTHKQTCTNLQRAQSALQTCRQNAQSEVKRKERELERMVERWNKVVADQQTKIGGIGANMKCANLIVDGSAVPPRVSRLETLTSYCNCLTKRYLGKPYP